jgi:hypothetical protein
LNAMVACDVPELLNFEKLIEYLLCSANDMWDYFCYVGVEFYKDNIAIFTAWIEVQCTAFSWHI